ncbi:MAG: flagellar type III secretion system pore protein FliP [Rickettsiales endosymbiont of Dermacentor nuttalli]
MRHLHKTLKYFVLFSVCVLFTSITNAEPISFNLDDTKLTSRILQTIALITIMSLAPSILVMITSFTRIIVVLSFLRNALGIQQSPPNTVLISLSLFLTAFIMSSTFETAYHDGIVPLMEEKMTEQEAIPVIIKPFQSFMLKHTRDKDLALFLSFTNKTVLDSSQDTPLEALVPAFMISELKRAFEIGFLIFIPFLIIDILVSSILMAMGMMMLPPVAISLPFKLIFFVIIDGWHMICGSLIKSYGL